MNLESLMANATQIQGPQTEGQWRPIRLSLDPASGEQLNIGIAFENSDGTLSAKMIESFQRVTCLYGPDVIGQCRYLIDMLKANFENGSMATPSPSIKFGERNYACGDDSESILDRLFEQFVPLGWENQKAEAEVAQVNEVKQIVRLAKNMSNGRLKSEHFGVEMKVEKQPIKFDFAKEGVVFNIGAMLKPQPASATEASLMRKIMHLEFLGDIATFKQRELIVFRPEESNPTEYSDYINWLGERVEKQGVTLFDARSKEFAAERILSKAA